MEGRNLLSSEAQNIGKISSFDVIESHIYIYICVCDSITLKDEILPMYIHIYIYSELPGECCQILHSRVRAPALYKFALFSAC